MRLVTLAAALALVAALPACAFAQGEDGNVPPSGLGYAQGVDIPVGDLNQAQSALLGAIKAIEAKDFATAQRLATAASRLEPLNVDARKLLGAAQMGAGDWSGAARSYTAVVRLEPTDPVGRAGLGVSLAMLNDPKAQAQLSWLTAREEKCAGRCPDAKRLAALTRDVRTALGPATWTSE